MLICAFLVGIGVGCMLTSYILCWIMKWEEWDTREYWGIDDEV